MISRWLNRHTTETEGQAAREAAERQLQRVRSETPMYERIGHEARALLIENHIAADIAAAIRGRGA